MKKFLFRMLCGFFLAASILAPGVSGSVIAVMMGIYTDLIEIVSNPFKNLKKNILYLIPMGIGAVVSALLFVKLLGFLFSDYETQARMLFLGLVVGGLPDIWKQAKGRFLTPRNVLACLAALALSAGLGVLVKLGVVASAVTPGIPLLCAAGFVAGVASMMPGMSVSTTLMMFGVYTFLMEAASAYSHDLAHTVTTLLPVGLAFLVGMVLFSRLTKLVFRRFTTLAYYMVFGFMCGTLVAVWPEEAPAGTGGWISAALMLLLGLGLSMLFGFLGKRFSKEATPEPAQV